MKLERVLTMKIVENFVRFGMPYTSLVPTPMIVVFGLGTRLHVHMRRKLEDGVLRNGQQLVSSPDPPSNEEKRSGEPSRISWASAHFCDNVT